MSLLSRSGRLACPLGCLVLAGSLLAVTALAAGPPAARPDTRGPAGPARTEIGLPGPERYAMLLKEPEQTRRLVARGEVLFHPQDASRAFTVERVEAGGLFLREGPRGRVHALRPGSPPLPGFPGWRFAGTVLLTELHYRYKVVDRLEHPDPVLVALEGARALLEVEVLRPPAPAGGDSAEPAALPALEPPSPARATLDGDLLEQVRVQEVGRGRYEVNPADVQSVLENAGRVLADLEPLVLPSVSLRTGLEYRITSAAADGVLSRQGFTVTAPKLAERAGLQVGDTVLSVNGQPVDGFASLYRIFQAVRQDPALRTVQVELSRRGTRLTQTYRIR